MASSNRRDVEGEKRVQEEKERWKRQGIVEEGKENVGKNVYSVD